MRVGIVGNIYGYAECTTSYGQGLIEDAAKISRQNPEATIRVERQDGKIIWLENGEEISEPQWWSEQAD